VDGHDALVVTGLRRFDWDTDEVRFLRRGIFYGEFTRHIPLLKGLKRDDVEAHYEDGILELTIPVSEEVKPKRISIGTGRKAITS
jgi:HSP20 family protein